MSVTQGAHGKAAGFGDVKAAEQPHREHPLDGIPTGMPPLARAAKVASRLDRAGRSGWLDTWVAEQVDSGNRPSTVQRVTLGARRDGTLTAIVLDAEITLGIDGWHALFKKPGTEKI